LRAHRRNLSHRAWISAARKVVSDQLLPDAIFGQFLHPSGEAAAVIGNELGVPAFVELSEDTSDRWFISRSAEEVRTLLRRFDGIIAVSENLAHTIEDLGVDREKVLISPNGVDPEVFFPADRRAVREELELPKSDFLTVTVARHVPEKGVQVVADALAHVEGAAGLFVGGGPSPPIGGSVLRSLAVPHDHVPPYLRAADVFVLATLAEGCPNAVLEAMAIGLPLVLSDRPFMREIADESMAIFVDPTSVGSVGKAIETLLNDKDRRLAMGDRAQNHAMNFTIEERATGLVRWMRDRQL